MESKICFLSVRIRGDGIFSSGSVNGNWSVLCVSAEVSSGTEGCYFCLKQLIFARALGFLPVVHVSFCFYHSFRSSEFCLGSEVRRVFSLRHLLHVRRWFREEDKICFLCPNISLAPLARLWHQRGFPLIFCPTPTFLIFLTASMQKSFWRNARARVSRAPAYSKLSCNSHLTLKNLLKC